MRGRSLVYSIKADTSSTTHTRKMAGCTATGTDKWTYHARLVEVNGGHAAIAMRSRQTPDRAHAAA